MTADPTLHSPSAIAVVGMACHFPGSRNANEFWNHLREGVAESASLNDEQLSQAGVSPEKLSDPRYVRSSLQLQDLKAFDASFFGMSPKDAAIMDPQHRHFLECAWEALEDAGHDPARLEGPVGVFGGCGMNSYYFQNLLRNPSIYEEAGPFLLRHTGNDKDFLTTFVSYKLGLEGPSVGVQTACSTSLVAVHLAAQSLLSGECDTALAGGSTIEFPHGQGYLYRENEILAKDGICRPFDAEATGTIFGSGAGVVVLRRLEDALASGDSIRAVILGSAINNDGARKVGWLAPSVQGQADAAMEALAVAGVDPASIAFLETHGTGTAMGDPIEIEALNLAYRSEQARTAPCMLGAVKANIGHLDTAAGVAGLIKVVHALQERSLPPNIHFQSSNPEIDFGKSPFGIEAGPVEFSESELPLRAAVNSLGVGGTNAHIVLERAPEQQSDPATRALQVLPLSARSPMALKAACERLAQGLDDRQSLADIAFTLQEGRRAFQHRTCVVAVDHASAQQALIAEATRLEKSTGQQSSREDVSLAFLFPGGGSQYPGMAAGLIETEPVFRATIEEGCRILRDDHQIELAEVFAADHANASLQLERPSVQLPAVFLVEIALARLWESWGVSPHSLLGHSLGENTAACVAGVFRFDEALGLVALRGKLFEQLPAGGMLSIAATADDLEPFLNGGLVVGAHNAPDQTMVSGSTEAITSLTGELEAAGLDFQRVKIDCAAHSPALDPVLPAFRARLESMHLSAPKIPIVSNLTGTWLTAEQAQDPEYWVRHLRETVRFSEGIATLQASAASVFLELGPGRTLGSLARIHPALERDSVVLPSLRHRDENVADQELILQSLGSLWSAGAAVDWARLRGSEKRLRVPLPTYPFERREYWVEPQIEFEGAISSNPQEIRQLADQSSWFAVPTWIERASSPRRLPARPERWLVFLDRHGCGESLVEQLRANDNEVICVREGDAFYRFGAEDFAVAPEGGRSGYEALFTELASGDRLPNRIVHLWSLTKDQDPRPGSSLFHHHQERGFFSLLFLAQAIGEHEFLDGIQLDVFANQMQSVRSDDQLRPEKATLLGPALVIPREYEGVRCRTIDILLRDHFGDCFDELMNRESVPQLAWRDGRRFELDRTAWRPAELNVSRESSECQLNAESVTLVTGGLGDLGLTTAASLARETKTRLVLLGRSRLPARESWPKWLSDHSPDDPTSNKIQRVLEIESNGTEVIILQADVANPEQMREVRSVLDDRYGRLDAIFHAAGVLEDGVMQLRSPEAIERVFAPKVQGARVLLQTLGDMEPSTIVLYSSTSVALGSAGQADYIAANAFLNALALHYAGDQNSKTRIIAVNWGVWKQVGMAQHLASHLRNREALDGEYLRIHDTVFDTKILNGTETSYRASLSCSTSWWLDEHRLSNGRAILPGTAFLELIRRAAELQWDTSQLVLENVQFLTACPVKEQDRRELVVTLRSEADTLRVEVKSRIGGDGVWELHTQGIVRRAQTDANLNDVDWASSRLESARGFVSRQQPEFLRLGQRWDCLSEARTDGKYLEATMRVAPEFHSELADQKLHPAVLDVATGCAVHVLAVRHETMGFWVPLEYGSVEIRGPLSADLTCRVELQSEAKQSNTASFDIFLGDGSGPPAIVIRGLRLRSLAGIESLCRHSESEAELPSEFTASERAFLSTLASGIDPESGMQCLQRVLRDSSPPVVYISSMDLAQLQRLQLEAHESASKAREVRYERPVLSREFSAATNPFEKQLVAWWEDLLDVDGIGIHDNFFELGGHSLVAVRLFGRVKAEFGVEYPLSILFETPTIAAHAKLLREELGEFQDSEREPPKAPDRGRNQFEYLVPMKDVRDAVAPPFFLVAGMFGNVLNLRHLAMHLGEDQQVYTIQARGLRADEEPHRRFEDMARDYISEIRKVQPHGPYLLGGFSGGGITAFEMARQLRAVGEETASLVLIDTPVPIPQLAKLVDRIRISGQRISEEGVFYLGKWLRKRVQWEWSKRQQSNPEARAGTPAEFRSESVKDGFLEALSHYELQSYPGLITLFRPKLSQRFKISHDRHTNEFREIQDVCNHWLPYAQGGIDTFEVDGDHDSMVLEPHVRVLGVRMRSCLEEAMKEWHKLQTSNVI
jgi:acyl transferase domain-containing protein/thioesterase domain-containing protein/acyl carrier protein